MCCFIGDCFSHIVFVPFRFRYPRADFLSVRTNIGKIHRNYFSEKEQNSLTEYEVGWIPEKYRLVANTSGDIFTTREWIYENYYITLDQTLSGNIHYDTEDVTLQEVIWGDKTITYYQKYNAYLFS